MFCGMFIAMHKSLFCELFVPSQLISLIFRSSESYIEAPRIIHSENFQCLNPDIKKLIGPLHFLFDKASSLNFELPNLLLTFLQLLDVSGNGLGSKDFCAAIKKLVGDTSSVVLVLFCMRSHAIMFYLMVLI